MALCDQPGCAGADHSAGRPADLRQPTGLIRNRLRSVRNHHAPVVVPPGVITRAEMTSYDGAGSGSYGRDPGGIMTMRGPWSTRRPSGWPVLRTPKWMIAAGVVLVAGGRTVRDRGELLAGQQHADG